jgi:CRISPR-associated endonuclease/helicase Cas3
MNIDPIKGDQKMEEVRRYRIHAADEEKCWNEVHSLLSANHWRNAQKVLWVCNTVKSAVESFREAKRRFPSASVLLYHSRYRYRDRVELQNAVIDEFRYSDNRARKHERPAIAITTQVCEMSLDISADLLVSAMCPLPSLVQRLGRLNRYATEDDPKPAFVFPFSGRPYHEGDAAAHLAATEMMIKSIDGGPCSQEMLGLMINELQSNEELPEYSAWLDGGWQSEQLPAREGDNSITIVRQEDLAGLKRLPNGQFNKDHVIPLTIPMLFQRGFDWTERAGGYVVALTGSVRYDWNGAETVGEGAEWQRQ